MDDSLLAEFQSTFMIGGDVVSNTHGPHPHYTLYKQRGAGGAFGSQEERRKKFLEEQKARRRNYADYARRVVEGDLSGEEDDEMEEGAFDEVDKGTTQDASDQEKPSTNGKDKQAAGGGKKVKQKPAKRKRNAYRNQLMLSEWLVDVPEDFEENWQFVVCPIGKRCIVVSGYGTTSAYNRSGQLMTNFPSLLPGGCSRTYRLATRDYCILDCIYNEITHTFHVLDIMCWGGLAVYDSDTEFRSYWKATKLQDEGEKLSKYSRINPLVFQDLTYHPCSKESFSEVLGGTWPLEVDGLLFVHKKAHYTIGRSPLASWLKPHMVPDILKMPVSEQFLSCAPTAPAVAMDTSMTKEQKKHKGRRWKKNRGGEKMDSSPSMASDKKMDSSPSVAPDKKMESSPSVAPDKKMESSPSVAPDGASAVDPSS